MRISRYLERQAGRRRELALPITLLGALEAVESFLFGQPLYLNLTDARHV